MWRNKHLVIEDVKRLEGVEPKVYTLYHCNLTKKKKDWLVPSDSIRPRLVTPEFGSGDLAHQGRFGTDS